GTPGYSNQLVFWLNGREVILRDPDPSLMLTDYLHEIGLTGTKVGCGQGGCGACTVMLSHRDVETGEPVHLAVNACLRPVCSLDGMIVTTTEGIGNVRDGLDPVQFGISVNNGSQCGFCTPGFVMNAHAYLRQNPDATEEDVEGIFGGNLCRCTGYRPILHGMRTLACDYDACADRTQKCEIDPSFPISVREEFSRIDAGVLPSPGEPARSLHFTGRGREWFRPLTLSEVYALKRRLIAQAGWDQVKVVLGNTGSGVYPHEKPTYLIDLFAIPELKQIAEESAGIRVGASVSIQRLIDFVSGQIERQPAVRTAGFKELARHAMLIAGYQVRSAGSIAGNIMMAKVHARRGEPFPSDLFAALGALGTSVEIGSADYDGGSREFLLMEMPDVDNLPDDALIISFRIPFTRPREYVQTFRVARRPQMSHPIVNAGFRCTLDLNGCVAPEEITIVYGGLTSLHCRATETERFLSGKQWNRETMKAALEVLKREIAERTEGTHAVDPEGISLAYRRQLAENFFYKFFLHVALETNPDQVSPENRSAASHHERPLSVGTQEYPDYPELHPLSRPIIKRAAFVQATGEVKYTQDVPLPVGGFHAAIVKSTRPHARFTLTQSFASVTELEDHLRSLYPDFRAIVTAADIPPGGNNLIGLGEDDPVFSDGRVTSVGAPIALAVAETVATAREAAHYVESHCVAYEDLPAVVTLEEAIKQNTAMPMILKAKDPDEDVEQRIPSLTRPGSDLGWLESHEQGLPATEQVSGSIRTGAQAHFYLETNCALAVPGMYDQLTIYSSTQNPNGNQAAVARVLGTKANQITVIVEQIGGGFGAKQHRAAIPASQAAVAARKLGRPVRLLYDRASDTQMIGKRHPYLGDYRVAYDRDGKLEGMKLDLNSDAGDTYDCSFAVMDLSLLQADGCYMVPTFQANGTVYRTNKPSNTAFRTFGNIQPYVVRENAIEHVAHELSRTLGRRVLPEEIRRKNMYRDGTPREYDLTHHGQDLKFCNLREIWDSLYASSEFERREREVQEFNRRNRWRKRGISMIPQKYGIAFTEPRGALNASSALVNVNMPDGSVFIQHGAVEMGQGVNTKIAQLAANTLGIPLERIRIAGNNSDAIVNAPATAGSTGYDLNGGAVEKACRVLRNRLEAFCRDMEQMTPYDCIEDWRTDWSEKWSEIIFKAWFNRVNLSAAELYASPHYKGVSERHTSGKPYAYFAYSSAVTEVEIDVLTGEFTILRADLLYDTGKSPNPAIDIGQIEGGYVQGVGFATTEEVVYDEKGRLVTDNIWSYKPPCSRTIPLDFRVKLHPVKEERNKLEAIAEMHAVKSSKTAGEPGMTLGITAYFAIKRAIMDARRDLTGSDEWLTIDLPATCQKIQSHCGVSTESLTL
ncbi:MAG: xanthine dehydrogenase, partial [Planctomycetes bacterium SCN 63-9]